MDSYEPHAHSFIVKIWVEEPVSGNNPTNWRGHITHVFTGERRYFQTVAELTTVIEEQLYQMGIQPTRPFLFAWWNKLRRWHANSNDFENP